MKRRVIHVLPTNSLSGAENVALRIIKGTAIMYDAYYVSPDGPIASIVRNAGLRHVGLDKWSVGALRAAVKEIRPDLVHAHDFRASILSSLVSIHLPVISHIHSNPPWITRINMPSLAYLLASARIGEIVSVSSAFPREYVFGKVISRRTSVLHNVVDADRVRRLADKNIATKQYTLAFVGRLTPQKDPLRFINLVSNLRKSGHPATAVMIGDGSLHQECIRRITELGLSEHVHLVGFQANPFPILRQCKMLVLTSKSEGFGLVAVEAMALGKPVLATPVGGLKEIVDGSCGKLCSSDSSFLSAASRILQSDTEMTRLATGALARAQAFGNTGEYIRRLLEIYQRCTEQIQ